MFKVSRMIDSKVTCSLFQPTGSCPLQCGFLSFGVEFSGYFEFVGMINSSDCNIQDDSLAKVYDLNIKTYK